MHTHDHHPHLELHSTGRRHRLHDVLDMVGLILIVLGAWYLWPASLGGNTRFVVVEGRSMEPRYHIGDVVMVKDNDHPQIGDVIVFRVPDGEPGEGMLVVHRVHDVRPDGSYETKGDNREAADPWQVRAGNILGEPQVTLPRFGRVIGIFSNPFIVGGAAGVLTMLFLWPRHRSAESEQSGAVDADASSGEPFGLDSDAREEPAPLP